MYDSLFDILPQGPFQPQGKLVFLVDIPFTCFVICKQQ